VKTVQIVTRSCSYSLDGPYVASIFEAGEKVVLREIQVLAVARPWGFKSPLPHQPLFETFRFIRFQS